MLASQPTAASALTIAIIGAGDVAQEHARAFAKLGPSVSIAAIADIDERRSTKLAQTYGARAFGDYRAALDLSPDIAVVCLPHHLHREVGEYASHAGCHILMEKPIAHTLEDGVAIVEACQRHQVLLTIGYVHRYRAEMRQAYDLIQAGQLGEAVLGSDSFCMQGGQTIPNWAWSRGSAGGGVLMYTGIHSIDRLRWLFRSEVSEVFARARSFSHDVDVEDGLVATLIFANGAIATLFETSPRYRVSPRNWDTELVGTKACMRIRTREYLEYSGDDHAYRVEIAHDDHFASQARDFVDAVRQRRTPWITGEDGIKTLAVALAIYRSAESGRLVSLSEITG